MKHAIAFSLVVTLSTTLAGSDAPGGSPRCGGSSATDNDQGFRIYAWHFIDLSPQGWSISIDGKQEALLRTAEGERRFRLKAEVFEDLRRVVESEDFWSLAPISAWPSIRSFQRIDVCDGNRAHHVTMNGDPPGPPTADDIRFLRIWVKLRRLFISKKAADVKVEETIVAGAK